ncbi:MAG: type II CAAX endopeptidase family protein [Candidatus Acidiferrales bacterium]
MADAHRQIKFFSEQARSSDKILQMAESSNSRQMGFRCAAVVWVIVVALATLAGVWMGYGGRRFVIAICVAAALFGFALLAASPRVMTRATQAFGGRAGVLAPLVPMFAVLTYALGVTGDWKLGMLGAGYAVLPSLLLAGSRGKQPGAWEDYAAALLIWLPVEFQWMYRVFVYPSPHGPAHWPLTHTLTILLAVCTALAAFVFVRRMDGIGYAVEWRRGFGPRALIYFLAFAAIAIPLAIKIHFISFAPTAARWRYFVPEGVGILMFTAWPEEFFFRGILQNMLSRSFKSDWAGLCVASVIFGFSHILHAPYPNWKYVALATIAGLFYGRVWMKSRSLVPSTIVHAAVDTLWHFLFR